MTRARSLSLAFLLLSLPAGSSPPADDCPAGAAAFAGSQEASRLAARRAVDLFAASHAPGRSALAAPAALRTSNLVDQEISRALEAAGVAPAPLASDAAFLRRLTLDLTGRIPDFLTAAAFLGDPAPDRRTRKIDELLASDAFVDRWAFFLSELYRVTAYSSTSFMGTRGRNAWHAYFVDALRRKRPYDEIARTVLTASGVGSLTGPANFVVRDVAANGPPHDTWDNLAASTGRALLGTNLFCISCHDGAGHTSDLNLWLSTKTRRDFWETSAFFAETLVRAEYLPDEKEYRWEVFDLPFLGYRLDTTDGNKSPRKPGADGVTLVEPRFLLTGEVPRLLERRRTALARLVTSHRQFSRATVNYVWKELFNLGIVEPVDGFDLARLDPENPPPEPWTLQATHPALLERLAESFERSGYDLRALIRLLVTSTAYQLSSSYPGEWRPEYLPLFARHVPRRLRAEELYDSISIATLLPLPLHVNGFPAPVAWAHQLPDVREPLGKDPNGTSYVVYDFLNAFGRGDRDLGPRSGDGSALQAIHLLNNPLVTFRVRSSIEASLVSRVFSADLTADERVDVLFLATLTRFPSDDERREALRILRDPGTRPEAALEDLQFALLNKLDFVFSY